MAQLKDTTISGSLRVTDNIYSTNMTAADSFTVNNTDAGAVIAAKSVSITPIIKAVDSGITNTDAHIAITIGNTSGRMGLWSSGYYTAANRSSFSGDGQWMIYRDVNGKVVIPSMTSTDGIVQIASGGTGANSAAKAKENLGLGSELQNFMVVNNGGDEQHWGLRAVVQNNAAGTKHYVGRQNTLILLDTGLLAFSSLPSNPSTIKNNIWSLGLDSSDNLHYYAAIPPVNVNENNATSNSTRMSVNLYHTGNVIYNASTPTGTINEGTIWLQPIS